MLLTSIISCAQMDHHPLLPTTTAATAGDETRRPNIVDEIKTDSLRGIIFRFMFIAFIGTIAIWANYQAARGFSVTVVNDAGKYSSSGKIFSLFYESNDKATRIVLSTSKFVENLLYPHAEEDFRRKKKQVNSVILRLAASNLSGTPVTIDYREKNEFIVNLSPLLMRNPVNNEAVVSAVQQGMARVWLWDGNGEAPPVLLNGMAEYIAGLAGFPPPPWSAGGAAVGMPGKHRVCWKDEDPRRVAEFLRFCDGGGGSRGGGGGGEVVRRLNDGMRNGWEERMMDDALGMPAQHACASFAMVEMHHYHSSM